MARKPSSRTSSIADSKGTGSDGSRWRRLIRRPGAWVLSVLTTVTAGVLVKVISDEVGRPPGRAAQAPTQTVSPATSADSLPFTVAMTLNDANIAICQAYVIDKPAPEVPPPRSYNGVPVDNETWARKLGAVASSTDVLSMTLQGKATAAVVLERLVVHVVARRPPITAGAAYFVDTGCGGGVSPRLFEVDLDTDPSVAVPREGVDDAQNPIPAMSFPFKISSTDPEVFQVYAYAMRCDCSWYLDLAWTYDGRTSMIKIDDNGQPFRTAGVDRLSQFSYQNGRWIRMQGAALTFRRTFYRSKAN